MAKHAKLSPSASARWMTCPGSIKLIDSLPPEVKYTSSPAAARGTAIHKLSEACLENGIEPETFLGQDIDGFSMTSNDVSIAKTYVDYVRKAKGDKFYELKVSLKSVIDNCFGTADAVIARQGHLAVVDLKSGAGVKVDANDNTQLLIYALGAYHALDWIYDVTELTLVIVQPALNHIDEYRIDVEQLALKRFVQAIEDEAQRRLELDSSAVPGFKLVRGRSLRRWTDEHEVVQRLTAFIDEDQLYDSKLKSPAQVEKLLKTQKVKVPDFEALVCSPEGRLTLASEDDKRPAVTSAGEDFK